MPGYASCVEVRSGERRAEDAAARRAEGWRAIKLRLHDWTIAQDIAQVEGVRRAMGDEFVILVDANQAQQPGTPQPEEGPVWRYERALQTARELQRLGVFWLEEPLDRYDFDGLRRLCAAVDLLIAGGENNRGLHELRWLIEQDVYDVIQPEAMVAETMSGLRKVAALAEMHHKLVAPHHGGGGLGLVAHLHLACAIPNSTYFEMLHEPPGMSAADFQWYMASPLTVDPNGDIRPPKRPASASSPTRRSSRAIGSNTSSVQPRSSRKHTVLIVDDEPRILDSVRMNLELEGYQVFEATNGQEALDEVRRRLPDLVVMDVMMPEMDGFEALRELRRFSAVPVVLLTVKADERDVMHGLDLGADDYVAKPFSPGVLISRIKAVLRRAETPPQAPVSRELKVDDRLTIDFDRHEVWKDGEKVQLRPTEFRLLYHLASNPGVVMTHETLLSRVWGPEYRDASHYVRLYINYLRQKLEDDPANPRYILTERGVGYRFADYSRPRPD